MNWTQFLISVTIPIVTAAVGSAGITIQDRRKRKDLTLHHREQVEKAQLEVKFVTDWVQARKLLEPRAEVSAEVEAWLDRCYQSAEKASSVALSSPRQQEQQQQQRTQVFRRLLVLRHLTGVGAEIFRLAYWVSFIFLNVCVIWAISEFFAALQPGGTDEGSLVVGILFFCVILSIISIFFRQLCIALDRSARLKLKKD